MTNKYKIHVLLMLVLTFILGMIVGQQGTIEGEDNEENKIITDKIAIVNMDEGIFIENERLNYGAALLNDLDNNFLVTGLEDARQGMKLGIYAAYIIIPTTFSDDVVSLNSRPQQSQTEQNRCAIACQGCGAVFLLFLKKAVDYFLKSIYW